MKNHTPLHDECVDAALRMMRALDIYVPHAFDVAVREALGRVRARLGIKRAS